MGCGPVSSTLNPVYWRAICQRVNRPVMSQVVRRQVGNADLLAEQADAIIDAIAGDTPIPCLLLLADIAEQKRPAGAPLGSQVVIERHPGVPFQPVDLPVLRFLAIDRDGASDQVELLDVERNHLTDAERVLDEESHHERVLCRERTIARATLAVDLRGGLFQPQRLLDRDGRGHGLLRALARRLPLLGARCVDIASFLVAIALDRLNELIVFLADGSDLARQITIRPDRREAQIDGADGVALLAHPGAVAEDEQLADAGPGAGIVVELLDGALHTGASKITREVQQVEALAGARVGRALLMVVLKRIRGQLAELLRQVTRLLHILAVIGTHRRGWEHPTALGDGGMVRHGNTSLSHKESYTTLPSVGLYPLSFGLSRRRFLPLRTGRWEAFSGVLHYRDLAAVTIARGSAQGVAAPQEAWSYAEMVITGQPSQPLPAAAHVTPMLLLHTSPRPASVTPVLR